MASSYGTKVTSDPVSQDPIPEAVGTITSDSLAAESLSGTGSFAADNPKAAAMSQPSYSTTTNNRDTSGATVLAAAPDAEAREAQEGWSENAQLNAGRGLGKAEGRGPTYATPGDERAMAAREGGGGVGGQEYNTSTGSGRNVGTAPTGGYAGASEQAKPEGDFRPKGKGITEGGIDGDAPNASFNQDVGGKKDPGRLAEREFQKGNAGGAGIGPRQVDVSGEVIYDTLTVDEET